MAVEIQTNLNSKTHSEERSLISNQSDFFRNVEIAVTPKPFTIEDFIELKKDNPMVVWTNSFGVRRGSTITPKAFRAIKLG